MSTFSTINIHSQFAHETGSWQELLHRAKTMRSLVTCLTNQSFYSSSFFIGKPYTKKAPLVFVMDRSHLVMVEMGNSE